MPDITATTPAATASAGQQGMNLPVKIMVTAGAMLVVGNYIGQLFGADGTKITSALMVLFLVGIIIDHLRPSSATVDDKMINLGGKLVLWVVIFTLAVAIAPKAATQTKELLYSFLPENTERETRRRADQFDLKTAHAVRSDNNEGLQTLLEERQVLAEQADKDLAARNKTINAKLGTFQCWGWDGKKSLPKQYCNNERVAAELDASRAQYDRDVTVAERQQPSGSSVSSPSVPALANNVLATINSGWSWLTQLRPKTQIEVLIVVVVGLAAFLRATKATGGSHA